MDDKKIYCIEKIKIIKEDIIELKTKIKKIIKNLVFIGNEKSQTKIKLLDIINNQKY